MLAQASNTDADTRVARLGTAWISRGSADLVAGPGDNVRGVPTPKILEVQRKIEDVAETVREAANKLITKGMSPRRLGTMLHTMFKVAVDAAIKRGELPRAFEQNAHGRVDKTGSMEKRAHSGQML